MDIQVSFFFSYKLVHLVNTYNNPPPFRFSITPPPFRFPNPPPRFFQPPPPRFFQNPPFRFFMQMSFPHYMLQQKRLDFDWLKPLPPVFYANEMRTRPMRTRHMRTELVGFFMQMSWILIGLGHDRSDIMVCKITICQ